MRALTVVLLLVGATLAASSQRASAQELAAFEVLDENRDGRVTLDEARARVRRLIPWGDSNGDGLLNDEELGLALAAEQFFALDVDRSGALEWVEFRPLRGRRYWRSDGTRQSRTDRTVLEHDSDRDRCLSEAELLVAVDGAFRRADADADGELNQAEVEALRRRRPGGRSDRWGRRNQGVEIADPFYRLDTDGNGALSLAEYQAQVIR